MYKIFRQLWQVRLVHRSSTSGEMHEPCNLTIEKPITVRCGCFPESYDIYIMYIGGADK